MPVTRDHVLRMLRISGYDSNEARGVLARLQFPAEIDDVIAVFRQIGINADVLTDEIGGSP